MRRFLYLALVLGIAAVPLIPQTVAASPPTRLPSPGISGTIPAGLLCPFAIDTKPVGNSTGQTETDFYDRTGNLIRKTFTGPLFIYLKNDSTGKAIVVNASGPGTVYPQPPGSAVSEIDVGRGQGLIGLFPSDEGGPALLAVDGLESFTRDADGNIHNLVIVGTVTDLCAALAA